MARPNMEKCPVDIFRTRLAEPSSAGFRCKKWGSHKEGPACGRIPYDGAPRIANIGEDCESAKRGTIRNYTFAVLIIISLQRQKSIHTSSLLDGGDETLWRAPVLKNVRLEKLK